jgi:hypothetical protein
MSARKDAQTLQSKIDETQQGSATTRSDEKNENSSGEQLVLHDDR